MAVLVQDRDGAKTTLLSLYLATPMRFVFAATGFAGRLVGGTRVLAGFSCCRATFPDGPPSACQRGQLLIYVVKVGVKKVLTQQESGGHGRRCRPEKRLIPVYAVGVFLAFTLSQTGMVVHWRRRRSVRRLRSLAVNAAGAVLSVTVLITAVITTFTDGVWVALLTVGLFVLAVTRIRRHYTAVDTALRLRRHAIELAL